MVLIIDTSTFKHTVIYNTAHIIHPYTFCMSSICFILSLSISSYASLSLSSHYNVLVR